MVLNPIFKKIHHLVVICPKTPLQHLGRTAEEAAVFAERPGTVNKRRNRQAQDGPERSGIIPPYPHIIRREVMAMNKQYLMYALGQLMKKKKEPEGPFTTDETASRWHKETDVEILKSFARKAMRWPKHGHFLVGEKPWTAVIGHSADSC